MNVKQGDLAILTKAMSPSLVGSIVEVCDFWGDMWGQKNVWSIALNKPAPFFNPETGERGIASADELLAAPDEWLRPVSGLPDTDDTNTEQPINNEVAA